MLVVSGGWCSQAWQRHGQWERWGHYCSVTTSIKTDWLRWGLASGLSWKTWLEKQPGLRLRKWACKACGPGQRVQTVSIVEWLPAQNSAQTAHTGCTVTPMATVTDDPQEQPFDVPKRHQHVKTNQAKTFPTSSSACGGCWGHSP